eukprot:7230070-Prymnesium_polylepis.2
MPTMHSPTVINVLLFGAAAAAATRSPAHKLRTVHKPVRNTSAGDRMRLRYMQSCAVAAPTVGIHPLWDVKTSTKMVLTAPCRIWYVGAHVKGSDGQRLHRQYPCVVDVFEPVAPFLDSVREIWTGLGLDRGRYHTYGLAAADRTVRSIPLLAGHNGAATFAMKSTSESQPTPAPWLRSTDSVSVDIKLRSVMTVWQELAEGKVDAIYLNCEGCEYEVLPAMLEANLLRNLTYIEWRPHENFGEVSDIDAKYCRLQWQLDQSHSIEYREGGPSYAERQRVNWERWIRRVEPSRRSEKLHASWKGRGGNTFGARKKLIAHRI